MLIRSVIVVLITSLELAIYDPRKGCECQPRVDQLPQLTISFGNMTGLASNTERPLRRKSLKELKW